MEDPAGVVERAARGDRDAWAQIWDEHAPALHRYARRMLDQDSDAADAVADTFVAAAQHLAKLRDAESLRPWLYAICKREIQRQWRGRDRVRPVEHDVLVAIGDSGQSVTPEVGAGVDASEAATLIWDAAEGLSAADRELLALALSNDLDSAAVARTAGVSAQAIHVKVSRLKDSLGKAAGALLLARRHRRDCDELEAVLAEWDGIYTTVWRKRIARHIEGCAECADRQKVAAGALFALAPAVVLVLPGALRESVLDRVSALSSSGSSDSDRSSARLRDDDFGPDGFARVRPWPEPAPARRRRRILAVALAAFLALGVAALLLIIPSGSRPTLQDAAGTPSPSVLAPTQPASPTSASIAAPPEATTAPETSASAEPEPTPEPSLADEPEQPADEEATEEPSIAAPPPPLPAAPRVALSLSQSEIQVQTNSCETTTQSQANVSVASEASVQVVVSWAGSNPGSVVLPAGGPYVAVIGPFTSIQGDAEFFDVIATATDTFGQTTSASRRLAVSYTPC